MRIWMPTRRALIAATAVTAGGLAGAPAGRAETGKDGAPPPATRTALHQEIALKASPKRLYEILLDAKQFASFTGASADIDPKAGGAFTLFAGQIVGRNVELIPAERIVQAWRPVHWDPGVYSLVRFSLKAHGGGTLVALDHTGFPEGAFDDLDPAWKSHYWDPLTRFLG